MLVLESLCSFVAGNLLLYLDPYRAFVCFANLLNSPFFHAFLKCSQEKMKLRYDIFLDLFRENLTALARYGGKIEKNKGQQTNNCNQVFSRQDEDEIWSNSSFLYHLVSSPLSSFVLLFYLSHFELENVSPELFFMEHCMTLFCKSLSLDVVGRVWDCYFIFGEAFVYRFVDCVSLFIFATVVVLGRHVNRVGWLPHLWSLEVLSCCCSIRLWDLFPPFVLFGPSSDSLFPSPPSFLFPFPFFLLLFSPSAFGVSLIFCLFSTSVAILKVLKGRLHGQPFDTILNLLKTLPQVASVLLSLPHSLRVLFADCFERIGVTLSLFVCLSCSSSTFLNSLCFSKPLMTFIFSSLSDLCLYGFLLVCFLLFYSQSLKMSSLLPSKIRNFRPISKHELMQLHVIDFACWTDVADGTSRQLHLFLNFFSAS